MFGFLIRFRATASENLRLKIARMLQNGSPGLMWQLVEFISVDGAEKIESSHLISEMKFNPVQPL